MWARLRLERDHAHVARLELALLLDRLEQLLVVEVAVAEVPAGDDAGDQLALADVVVVDVVDGARRAARSARGRGCACARKASPLSIRYSADLAVVELRQLLDVIGATL